MASGEPPITEAASVNLIHKSCIGLSVFPGGPFGQIQPSIFGKPGLFIGAVGYNAVGIVFKPV